MDFAQIILSPFVWLLTVFYNLFGSYGLALIFFAIVVKLILFPFSLKGKRSMIQMNMLSDKMQKLQKQYGKDKERYNLEVQKLYEKEKVNPMSGCLWSFVPLLILLPLYAIIRQPLKYMMGVNSQDLLNAVANAVQWNSAALDMGWIKEAADSFANTGYNQLYLASLITPENLASVQAAVGEAGSKIFSINFDFLGLIDLSQTPQLKFWDHQRRLWPVPAAGHLRRVGLRVLPHLHEDEFRQPEERPGGQQRHGQKHAHRLPPDVSVDRLCHARRPVRILDRQQPFVHAPGIPLRQAAEEGL